MIDKAANFLGQEAKKVGNNALTAGKNVLNDSKAAANKSVFNVPGATVFSILQNSTTFAAKTMMMPIEYMLKLGGLTAKTGIKTGLQLLSLIPIPFPAGPDGKNTRTIAGAAATVRDARQAISVAARGDNRPLRDIMGDLTRQRTGADTTTPNAEPRTNV